MTRFSISVTCGPDCDTTLSAARRCLSPLASQILVINGINAAVKKSKNAQLVGFGTFKVSSRNTRARVNPKKRIRASKTVKFVTGIN